VDEASSRDILAPSERDGAVGWTRLRRGVSFLGLGATRSILRPRGGRIWAAAIAVVVAIASMIVGGMVQLVPTQGGYTVELVTYGAPSNWWYYPELLVVQPWGIVQLAFLPTIATLLVAVGAGIGSAAALRLLLPVFRLRPIGGPQRTAAGVAAGLGPGVASFATLGACCCTTCSALGGLALVAAASGTSPQSLLTSNWYLPVFQVGIVYAFLLAQERSLRALASDCGPPVPLDRRFAFGAALRIGLLIAGVSWSIAMLVEWGSGGPGGASAAEWYHWTFEHQLLSLAAIVAAMFPREATNAFARHARSVGAILLRAALAIAAVTWGGWVPPLLVKWGLGGFLNELLGYWGLPASWGAVAPDGAVGAPLIFHWAFQHLLLAGFALVLALRPSAALAPLRWTVARDANDTSANPAAVRPRSTRGRQEAPSNPTLSAGAFDGDERASLPKREVEDLHLHEGDTSTSPKRWRPVGPARVGRNLKSLKPHRIAGMPQVREKCLKCGRGWSRGGDSPRHPCPGCGDLEWDREFDLC
jgi:hypothetical protein